MYSELLVEQFYTNYGSMNSISSNFLFVVFASYFKNVTFNDADNDAESFSLAGIYLFKVNKVNKIDTRVTSFT